MTVGTRPRRAIRSALAAALLGGTVASGVLLTPAASAAPQKDVTICHADSAVSKPYQRITVDANSIIKDNGHGSHTGPVYPTPGWGDVIPPFEYADAGGGVASYPGLNWNAGGIAVWEASCSVVLTPPEPTEPPSPSESSAPPSESSAPPSESSVPPSESSVPPSESSVPPSESSVPPSESSVPPSESSVPPSESSVPPASVSGSVTSSGGASRPVL